MASDFSILKGLKLSSLFKYLTCNTKAFNGGRYASINAHCMDGCSNLFDAAAIIQCTFAVCCPLVAFAHGTEHG